MNKFEAVLSCTKGDGIDVWDLRSGTHLRAISAPTEGSFQLVDDDHVVLCARDKPGLQVWSWKSGQQKMKAPLSDKIVVVAVSPDGLYCAGGSATGKLLVWDILSGQLLKSWDAHYKGVSALKFTSDGAFLVAGSEDARVTVWLLGDCVSIEQTEAPSAFAEWAEHTLPVTAVHCGEGGLAGRILTSSLDRTCKLWDIPSKSLVSSFVFPSSLHCAALDPAETFLVAGGADGVVYRVNLVPVASAGAGAASGAFAFAAGESKGAGAAGSGSDSESLFAAMRSDADARAERQQQTFVGHSKAVTGVALSFDGSLLVSSSADGSVKIWDSLSRQMLKTLRKQRRSCDSVLVVTDAAGFLGQTDSKQQSKAAARASFPVLQRAYRPVAGGSSQQQPASVRVKRRAVDARADAALMAAAGAVIGDTSADDDAGGAGDERPLKRARLDLEGRAAERKVARQLADNFASESGTGMQRVLASQAAEADALRAELAQLREQNAKLFHAAAQAAVRGGGSPGDKAAAAAAVAAAASASASSAGAGAAEFVQTPARPKSAGAFAGASPPASASAGASAGAAAAAPKSATPKKTSASKIVAAARAAHSGSGSASAAGAGAGAGAAAGTPSPKHKQQHRPQQQSQQHQRTPGSAGAGAGSALHLQKSLSGKKGSKK